MTIAGVYSAGGIFLQTDSPEMASAVGFACDLVQEISLGKDVRTGVENAGIYESRASVIRRAPAIQFGTSQIATFLDLVGVGGRCINSDGTHPGLDAYQLAHDRCNARDLTNSTRYRVANGLIVPESLSVSHQGRAELNGRVYTVTDGAGNEPLIKATGITYPNTAIDTEEYGLFLCTVAGVNITGLKSLSIDFGLEVTQEDADGSIWPEWVSVGSVVTRITLSGVNPGWLDDAVIPIDGTPMTHANTTLRLVKYASGGSYDALASAIHIGITVAGLGCITTPASSRGRGVSTTEAMLYAIHDGTNTPLVVDTTFALA